MPIYSGADQILKAYHGETALKRIYLGSTLIADLPTGGVQPSPADIAGLSSWWDARAETYLTYSTGAEVQTWNDRHGTSHMTQATASKQADWANNRFGSGIGGLDFDGGDGYLMPFNVAASHTMFAVFINDDFNLIPFLMGRGCWNNSDTGAAIRLDALARGITCDGNTRVFSDNAAAATAGVIYRAIFRWDATRTRLMVDGSETDNETHAQGSFGTGQMGLGEVATNDGAKFFNGRLCMAGIYSGKYLSDAETAQLATILSELVP